MTAFEEYIVFLGGFWLTIGLVTFVLFFGPWKWNKPKDRGQSPGPKP